MQLCVRMNFKISYTFKKETHNTQKGIASPEGSYSHKD